jgi:hypothetical protein
MSYGTALLFALALHNSLAAIYFSIKQAINAAVGFTVVASGLLLLGLVAL